MSWLFSRALVEAFSPPSSSAIEPCAQLNVMPTPRPFWRNDKTMDCSRFSRFGLTSAVLTDDRGAALLMSFLAASRARTSASPEVAQVLRAPGRGSGVSSHASFARWNPESFGWRTAQCSLLGDSHESLETLPRWGSMRSGKLFLRRTLAPTMTAPACGSLLPTLTVCGNYNRKGSSATSGDGLVTALRRLPTLTARDWRSEKRTPEGRAEREKSSRGYTLPATFERAGEGGPLNPDWCEWFMGFPIGWTASVALEMPKFHEWQQQHTPRWVGNFTEEAA